MNTELLHLVMTVNSDRVQETADGFIVRDVVPVVDDVVMNSGLYPAEELAESYHGIDGKPAPIGHPKLDDGTYISAMNGEGLRNYYAGATCENVRYESGRVLMDVVINKKQAMAHPDGERLIAAINGLEPIHVSTGLLLSREQMTGNSKGKDYTWIARNMSFDHVALLLDEPGAATPEDGVGMWVNVDQEMVSQDMSMEETRDELEKLIRGKIATGDDRNWLWIAQTFDDYVVYEYQDEYYRIDYTTAGGLALTSEPVKVDKKVSYIDAINARVKKILDIVANAVPRGYTDPITPIKANDNGGEIEMTPEETKELVGNAVKAAVEPMTEELNAVKQANADLTEKLEANEAQSKSALVAEVAEITGLEANELQDMPTTALEKLAAKGKSAFAANGQKPGGGEQETYDMAE